MTYKPPGPFDSLIKDLLGNVQRNADATMRRLETADERNFQREMTGRQEDFTLQRDATARQHFLDDRDWDRENYLTDWSVEQNLQRAQAISQALPYWDEDDPRRAIAIAALEKLSQPLTLTGQAAREEVLNANVVAPDGSVWSLDRLVAEGIRQQDLVEMDDTRWNAHFNNVLSALAGEGSAAYKMGMVNSLTESQRANEDMMQSLFKAAGVMDENVQNKIRLGLAVTEQDLERGGVDLERARVALDMDRAQYDQYLKLAPLEQAQLEGQVEQLRQSLRWGHVEMFESLGLLPDDPTARRSLATTLGYSSVEEMQVAGQMTRARNLRMNEAQVMNAEFAAQLTNRNVNLADLNYKTTNWEFERTKMLADLKDGNAMAESALAAMNNGDVEALERLRDLAEVYPDILGGFNFESMLDRARRIRGNDDDIMEYERNRRRNLATTETIAAISSVQTYADTVASTMMREDLTRSPDGSYPALEAAVDKFLMSVTDHQIQNLLRTTRSQLRDSIIASTLRQKVAEDRSEDMALMDTLLSNIPNPDNPQAQQRWQQSFDAVIDRLGLDTEGWASVRDGAMSATDLAFTEAMGKARLVEQQADYYHQMTVGQWIDNQTGVLDLEAMINAGPVGLSMEDYGKMIERWEAVVSSNSEIADAPQCNLVTGAAEYQGPAQGASTFRADIPECARAAAARDNAAQMVELLSSLATPLGPEGTMTGMMYLDATGTAIGGGGYTSDQLVELWVNQGNAPEGFDRTIYDRLPAVYQDLIADEVLAGDVTPEELAEHMAQAEATAIRDEVTIVPPSGLPPLASMGIDMNSDEWRSMPDEYKQTQLEGSAEWWRVAANIANRATPPTPVEAEALARSFGFVVTTPASQEDERAARREFRSERYGNFMAPLVMTGDLLGAMVGMGPLSQQGFAESLVQPDGQAFLEAIQPTVDELMGRARRQYEREATIRRTAQEIAESRAAIQAAEVEISGNMGTPTNFGGSPTPAQPGQSGIQGNQATPQGTPSVPYDGQLPPPQLTGDGTAYVEEADSIMQALLMAESSGVHASGGDLTQGPGTYHAGVSAIGISQLLPSTASRPGYGVAPLVPGMGFSETLSRTDPEEYQRLSREFEAVAATLPVMDFVRFGRDYLAAMIARYDGDTAKGLAAYNWGQVGMDAIRNDPAWFNKLPVETSKYVTRIMTSLGRAAELPPITVSR